MFCHKCGSELKEEAKFCHKCGEKIEEKNKTEITDNSFNSIYDVSKKTKKEELEEEKNEIKKSISNSNQICCSYCNSEQVQKFSVIVTQESKTFNGSSVGVGMNGGGLGLGVSKTKGNINSQLLEIVKKPQEPQSEKEAAGCLSIAMFLLAIIFFKSNYFFGIIFVIIAVGGLFGIKNATKKYNRETQEYEKKIKKWEKSWYCNKCGKIFEK